MLQTSSANLPDAQQQRLHADFLADEEAYLRMRPKLLETHPGKWVAVCAGAVVAAGANLMEVMDQACAIGPHPYVAFVGAEDDVVFRVRHSVFAYDQAYLPFPMPRIIATFSNHHQTKSHCYGDVIPDTGSDVSLLPDADCKAIDLFTSPYFSGMAGGVGVGSTATLLYRAKVEIDGHTYSALIQPIPGATEHIIGRDVLNQQRVLFDGPKNQVTMNH